MYLFNAPNKKNIVFYVFSFYTAAIFFLDNTRTSKNKIICKILKFIVIAASLIY